MSANTQQLSDQEKANKWWDELNVWPNDIEPYLKSKHQLAYKYFGSILYNHLSESQIKEIWRKETSPTTTVNEGEEGFTKGEFVIESIKETNLGYVADIKIINNPDSLICSVWGDTKEEAEANAHLIAAAKDLYFNNDKNIDLLKELQRLLVYGNINLEQTLCKVNERLFKSQEVRAKANPKLP